MYVLLLKREPIQVLALTHLLPGIADSQHSKTDWGFLIFSLQIPLNCSFQPTLFLNCFFFSWLRKMWLLSWTFFLTLVSVHLLEHQRKPFLITSTNHLVKNKETVAKPISTDSFAKAEWSHFLGQKAGVPIYSTHGSFIFTPWQNWTIHATTPPERSGSFFLN